MGLSGETKVILTLDGQEARLTPVHHGARRAQELYRAHVKRPGSVDDFLAERREEAGREEREPADRERGKTASAVLNASAVLAFLKDEPGADRVLSYLGTGVISAGNPQEVLKTLLTGASTTRAIIAELRPDVRPHDEAPAHAAAALHEQTKVRCHASASHGGLGQLFDPSEQGRGMAMSALCGGLLWDHDATMDPPRLIGYGTDVKDVREPSG